ncbi:MAG: elongation factor G [Verrucomicrobia bacterium]|nr:elongation factor G [Verrucomicrobiota bacterium]MDA1087470.1 elongation factor G [Verrucomicrobiota bacterium]
MSETAVSDTRNIVLLGHTGSGKTTLVDALAFKMGINDRLGSVDDGTSVSDYTDEERERKTSIYCSTFNAEYKSNGSATHIFYTDTPGYADFYGQVVAASSVSDAALIVVDAHSGIQVGSNRGWNLCEKEGKARGIVITGLDRENTDAAAALQKIQDTWGARCVPVNLPAADGTIIDLLGKNIPDDLAAQVEEIKGSLLELAAETDDTLIEKFLAGEELTAEEISAGLRNAVATGGLVPVFFCAPLKGQGLEQLLDGVSRLLPSPAEVDRKDADGKPIDAAADGPLAGLVWRSVNDPFIGQLTFVRIFGGTLKGDGETFNATKGAKERLGACLSINGKNQDNVAAATPGQIVALAKLKHTGVNDVICAAGAEIHLASIAFPSPATSFSVRAKSKADDDKIGTALHRLTEEDPTIRIEHNNETHEMVLSGLGDVHLEVAVDKMRKRSHVEVLLDTPKVPYRETVTGMGEGHYRHRKQSGGRGQYGEVFLRVEPRDPSDEEWFVNAIVGGAIPGNFVPAVQKGVVEGTQRGAVAGYPVVNLKVTVYDGSYHDVDSSEIAFKIAGSRALREGMSKAKPVLLEPIMKVEVSIPDQFLGDINGDLNHKRGRILGMGSDVGLQVIQAEVPVSELFRYGAELRSITGGQGSFTMEFSRYDVVPSNLTAKIVAEAEKHEEED